MPLKYLVQEFSGGTGPRDNMILTAEAQVRPGWGIKIPQVEWHGQKY